jgi:transposase
MSNQPGTPDAGGAAHVPDNYPTRDCPLCGATVKNVPSHLRHECPDNGHGGDGA